MQIEFWFEFASSYSYPAAERVGALCADAGVELRFRPFLLGPIFAAQGWRDSPFNIYPAKGRYMWRDLERICQARGLPFRRPARFPQNGLNAARIAFVAQDEPWVGDFVRAVYRANYVLGEDIAEPQIIEQVLSRLGRDAETVIASSKAAAAKEAFRLQNERAVALGIFGAPSFVVDGELFWGDDRLEQAIAWASASARRAG
jgi:2-hydroxychromene-2-carboxylate isomerase